MNKCKQTQTTRLSYVALITKILYAFRIDTMGETMDVTHNKMDQYSLKISRVCIYFVELRNESMDDDKVIT